MKSFTIFNSSALFVAVLTVTIIGAIILSVVGVNRILEQGDNSNNDNQNPGIYDNENAADNGDSTPGGDAGGETGESTDGGGSGGSSSGGGNGGSTPGGDAEDSGEGFEDPQCLIARPGSIENVICDVNYITSEGVSIKITNNRQEGLTTKITITDCNGEKQDFIPPGGNKDFIFNCNPETYFDEEIHMTYLIDNSEIDVFGYVIGKVS